MAKLAINTGAFDEVLRKKAEPVPKVTKKIRKLIKDMFETMYQFDGVGLAAPQVGESLQIVVIDVGEGPVCLINPEIEKMEGTTLNPEGCLSLPGISGDVVRAERIQVTGLNEAGKPVRYQATDLFARCIQHELDHLEGILFVDKAQNVREE